MNFDSIEGLTNEQVEELFSECPTIGVTWKCGCWSFWGTNCGYYHNDGNGNHHYTWCAGGWVGAPCSHYEVFSGYRCNNNVYR